MISFDRVHGHLTVYRVRDNVRELVFSKHNTIWATLQTNLAAVLVSRSVEYGVDAIAWGSMDGRAGTFVASDYAGTTSTGTQGALVQAVVGTNIATFTGTFSFGATKNINYFEIGRGYTPAAAGVSQLFTGRYAYDNSILTGSSFITYVDGDSMIINWAIQLG